MSAREWCPVCRRYTDTVCGHHRVRILPIEPIKQPVPSLAEVLDLAQRARESIIRSAQVPEEDLGLKR